MPPDRAVPPRIREPSTTSYTNTGLNATTVYYYRVRASNIIGDSSYSDLASAATPAVVSRRFLRIFRFSPT